MSNLGKTASMIQAEKDKAAARNIPKVQSSKPEWVKIKDYEDYEINQQGEIRRTTVTLLDTKGKKSVILSQNGHTRHTTIANLLKEAFE